MKQDIKECLFENYMPYAFEVIMTRALPEIDGFKPSHRKLLYTMYLMNLIKGGKTKSANIVGQTMRLNPHGDAAIYETMVRLTDKNEALSIPYVNGKGNFGKIYSKDMAYAASRYTEAKLSGIANELFTGINKENVDMADNYDGTMKEPVLLPVTFPNILANVNTGIAVGMASSICSFNLIELCDYTISYLTNKDLPLLIPDFSTGGELIFNQSSLENINNNGLGSIKVKAKYTYDKENNCIEISEIPYTTTIEAIIDKVEELVKSQKIKEITDIRDETGLQGLKLTIDIKKNTNPDILMKKLFKFTSLEDSFSCNFNIIANNKPQVLGVKQIISKWIDFRKQCLKRELQYDIQQLQAEQVKLQGLSIILQDLDKAISLIRQSKSEKEAMQNLSSYFTLSQPQLDYISTIKMVNMNNEWLTSKINKLTDINQQLEINQQNISDDNYYKDTIISQLEYVKSKYGQPRKTTIIHEDEVSTISKIETVEDYNYTLVMTKQGYLKRNLKYGDNQKLKDDDELLQAIPSTNRSKLLFFTDKTNVYYYNSYELPTHTPSVLGSYMPSILGLSDEKIVHVVSTTDFTGHILFAYENGKVGKVTLKSYETKTNRKSIVNGYNLDSPLVSIHHITKDINMFALSSIDKALVINTSTINPKASKDTQGVNVMKSKNDSTMIEFKPVDDNLENIEYYRVSSAGVGKYLKK